MTTRFYLPSDGAAPVSPAFGTLWDLTGDAVRGPLKLTPSNTGNSNLPQILETTAGVVDVLHRQWSSRALAAQDIDGTITLTIAATETSSTNNDFLQARVYVVSGDGATVRGELFAGQTATSPSSNPADPNYELSAFGVDATAMRQLVMPVDLVSALDGDRIVLEVGVRRTNTDAANRGSNLRTGDAATDTEATTVGEQGPLRRPWVEFSQTLEFQSDAVTIPLSALRRFDCEASLIDGVIVADHHDNVGPGPGYAELGIPTYWVDPTQDYHVEVDFAAVDPATPDWPDPDSANDFVAITSLSSTSSLKFSYENDHTYPIGSAGGDLPTPTAAHTVSIPIGLTLDESTFWDNAMAADQRRLWLTIRGNVHITAIRILGIPGTPPEDADPEELYACELGEPAPAPHPLPSGYELLVEAGYPDASPNPDDDPVGAISYLGARLWLDLPEVYRHADETS